MTTNTTGTRSSLSEEERQQSLPELEAKLAEKEEALAESREVRLELRAISEKLMTNARDDAAAARNWLLSAGMAVNLAAIWAVMGSTQIGRDAKMTGATIFYWGVGLAFASGALAFVAANKRWLDLLDHLVSDTTRRSNRLLELDVTPAAQPKSSPGWLVIVNNLAMATIFSAPIFCFLLGAHIVLTGIKLG